MLSRHYPSTKPAGIIVQHAASVSTIVPPSNRRLYEPQNKESLPLQATRLKNKMHDRLGIYDNMYMNSLDQKENNNEGEKTPNRF